MLSSYTNQTIVLRIRSATRNAYNEYDYTNTNIKVRVTYKRSLFRNAQNEELLSMAIIHTLYGIIEGDRVILDGTEYPVQKVYPFVGLNGNNIGFKAIL
jgi:hypothetical protein